MPFFVQQVSNRLTILSFFLNEPHSSSFPKHGAGGDSGHVLDHNTQSIIIGKYPPERDGAMERERGERESKRKRERERERD